MAHGPGLRWALMGPMLLCHLAGGAGGLRHFLDHFGPLSEAVWAELGRPALTDGLKRKLIESVDAEIAPVDLAAVLADRDRLLVDFIAAKREDPAISSDSSNDPYSTIGAAGAGSRMPLSVAIVSMLVKSPTSSNSIVGDSSDMRRATQDGTAFDGFGAFVCG